MGGKYDSYLRVPEVEREIEAEIEIEENSSHTGADSWYLVAGGCMDNSGFAARRRQTVRPIQPVRALLPSKT